ncbi:MAG: arsenate reductase (glutaredoxin) [Rhizobiaceae bacterium]
MSEVTIWHNPRCSKSRQTLELLRNRGIEPRVVDYLKKPPTLADIQQALDLLDVEPATMMRTKESAWSENGLTRTSSRSQLLEAMAREPILIERPIVFANGQARIGRPPESVLEII